MSSKAQEGTPAQDPQFLAEVFPDELSYVAERWRQVYPGGADQKERDLVAERPTTDNNLVGLAFSGGGIRSATVNLGVAQALHRRGVFEHADYMSTVSGGGYLGSSISTAMRDGGPFPFAELRGATESAYVTWLRNHSNYLVQKGLLDFLRLFAILLRGILLNFLVIVPLLLVLAIVLALAFGDELTQWKYQHGLLEMLEERQQEGQTLTPSEESALAKGIPYREAYFFTPLVAGLLLLYWVLYPVVIRVFKVLQHGVSVETGSESSVKLRSKYELTFATSIAIIVGVAALESLPVILHWFHHLRGEGVLRSLFASVAGGGSVVALTILGRFMAKFEGLAHKLVLVVVGLLGFVLPLLLVVHVAEGLVFDWQKLDVHFGGWTVFAVLLGLILGGLLATFVAGRTLPYAEALGAWRDWISYGFFALGFVAPVLYLARLRAPGRETGDPHAALNWLLALLTAFTVATFVDRFLQADPKVRWNNRLHWLLMIGVGLIGGYAAFLLFPLFEPQDGSLAPGWLILLVAGALWMFTWLSLDVNLTSVHGLYRDRLAEAYLVGIDKDARRSVALADVPLETIDIEEDLDLHEVCGKGSKAPYHLVNTSLNLQSSVDPGVRERYADFFLFSKQWLGGHRTGYCRSEVLEAVFPQMDLATAMAISAAAAAPNMGKGTGSLVALMALLNVRLGYWVPNPRWLNEWAQTVDDPTDSTLARRFAWRVPPRAFLKEMLSRIDERRKWVNLSDGGHLENMATYELLRRRCKYIITGDAEADGKHYFNGLADLQRFARIDLGIEIEMDLGAVRLRQKDDGLEYAEKHCAFGTIRYPAQDPDDPNDHGETGYLIFIKQSMTGDEDETIRQYRARNPAFPHESTADQFFSEGQFEAYRALGYHIANGLFADKERIADYTAFEDWFKRQKSELAS